MDLAHPLRSLIPSLDWAVLEVLAGAHAGLGASAIARLAPKGSRGGQSAVLDRLVEHGLVLAEPTNHGFVYRLNREHLLAPAVLDTARSRSVLLERLTAELGSLVPAPLHASVFGSFARGEADESSDIDLLLVADGDDAAEAWMPALDVMRAKVERWTGNRCQCLVYALSRLKRLERAGEPIVDRWREEGIALIGPQLASLIEDARGVDR